MKLNDFELINLAQEGNEDAINLIYKKYKPIIVKKSGEAYRLVNHHGIEINDIVQEAYIALDEAIKNFKQTEDVKFYTFAMLCIERRITNFVKKNTNKRNMVLNSAKELDEVYEKTIVDETNIEDSLVIKDDNFNKLALLKRSLTKFEREVLDLRIKEMSLEEIADYLGKDLKAIYNATQRIKNKYKKIKIDD